LFANLLLKIHDEAKAALKRAQEEMKLYADRKRSDAPEYKEGDKVWLETKNLKIDRPSKKLTEKRIGPYQITKIISTNAVKLKLPSHFRIHPVFNVSSLRPFIDTIPGQKKIIPPPVDFEEGEEFEVEKIVNSRIKRGHLQYLVKWKGFTEDHDEWIDAKTNALHLKDLISEFYSKFPNAEGKRLTIRIPGKSLSGR
jgi:hypothetical protein